MIPKGWQKANLDSVVKIVDSLHKTPVFSEEGYPMIRVTDLNGGRLSLKRAVRVGKDVFEEFTRNHKPKYGDIIFSRVGSFGIPAFVDTSEPFCLGQNTIVISPKDALDSKYLYNLFLSTSVQNGFTRTVDGSSQKTLSLKTIRALEIALPPISEQKKIAEILSTWDRAIEATDAIIKRKIDAYFGLSQEMRSLAESDGEEFSFNDLFEIKIGGTPSRAKSEYWADEGESQNLWVAISDLKQKYISSTAEQITDLGIEKSNVKLIPAGTVIMSFKLSIGRKAILARDCYTNEAIAAFVIKDSKQLSNEYFYHALNWVRLDGEIDEAVKGKTLNKDKLKRLTLVVSSAENQKKIVALLEGLDAEIQYLREHHDLIKKQKKGLMQKLLTGKVRVKV